MACGQYHTVISTLEIGVLSCGKNDYGQLGLESTEPQKKFAKVKGALDGAQVKQLRCGYYHTIVLAAGEHVFGFGRNDYGQLGLGHITQRVFGPTIIGGAEGKRVCRVSAGCYHTVLIGSDGMLYVFGRNHHGQLGTGDTNERHSPYPVSTFLGKRIAKVIYRVSVGIRFLRGVNSAEDVLCQGFQGPPQEQETRVHATSWIVSCMY